MPFRGSVFIGAALLLSRQIAISDRDRSLLGVLATKVKVLTVSQVRRTWWPDCGSDDLVRRRLKRLRQVGLLQLGRMVVFPEVTLGAPLAKWNPGASEPDLRCLLAKTRRRWSRSIEVVTAVSITATGAAMYGGRARRVRPSEGTHDVHVAQVFLKKLSESSEQAAEWIGECELASESRGAEGVIPDALVRLAGQMLAVEVVGESYTLAKLQRFCAYCRHRGWSYELW
jgi:hypothetical protein